MLLYCVLFYDVLYVYIKYIFCYYLLFLLKRVTLWRREDEEWSPPIQPTPKCKRAFHCSSVVVRSSTAFSCQ